MPWEVGNGAALPFCSAPIRRESVINADGFPTAVAHACQARARWAIRAGGYLVPLCLTHAKAHLRSRRVSFVVEACR